MSPSANDCPSTSYTSQSSHGPMPHFSSTPEQANVQLLARQAAASCEYSLSRPPDRDAGTNSEGQFSSFGAWPGRTRLRECLETPQAMSLFRPEWAMPLYPAAKDKGNRPDGLPNDTRLSSSPAPLVSSRLSTRRVPVFLCSVCPRRRVLAPASSCSSAADAAERRRAVGRSGFAGLNNGVSKMARQLTSRRFFTMG